MFEPSLFVTFTLQNRGLPSTEVLTWSSDHTKSEQRPAWASRTGTLEKGTEDLATCLLNDLVPVLSIAGSYFSSSVDWCRLH